MLRDAGGAAWLDDELRALSMDLVDLLPGQSDVTGDPVRGEDIVQRLDQSQARALATPDTDTRDPAASDHPASPNQRDSEGQDSEYDTPQARNARASAIRAAGLDEESEAAALLHDLSFGTPAAAAFKSTGKAEARGAKRRSRSRDVARQEGLAR